VIDFVDLIWKICECEFECVEKCVFQSKKKMRSALILKFYAARIDCIIWKIAEPHTTKIKRASNHGPTGYCPSFAFCDDFGTLPRIVTYLLAFSLATRILCGGAIFVVFAVFVVG